MEQTKTASKTTNNKPRGIFAGIEDEEVFPVRQFFDAEKDLGVYKLKVISLISGIGKLTDKGFFSGTFEVLEAPAGSTKQPGSKVSNTISVNANIKYRTYFLKDSLRLCQAVLRTDKVDSETAEKISGEDNPCCGAELMATVSANTKDDGRVFARVSFTASKD